MTRRATVVLCVAILLLPRPGGAQTPPITLDYERFQLENGLDVVLHRSPVVPMVTVLTRYRVGSAHEPAGRNGLAHLFEHLMFDGTSNVPAGELGQRLVEVGGGTNAGTTRDATAYAVWVRAHALELAFYLDADRMAHLLGGVDQATLDRERDVVKNEFRERFLEQPYGEASFVVERHLFADSHPYHRPVPGSMAELDSVTMDDVREFFRAHYSPANASLVVVGDIDLPTTRSLVEKWYGAVPRGGDPPAPPVAGRTLREERRLVLEDEVDLPRLYVAWATPGLYEPGDAELDVVARVLAAGQAARLQRRLVAELEVAQSVIAFQESRELGSVFHIVVTGKPGHALEEVRVPLDEALQQLESEPIPAAELTGLVNRLRAQVLGGIESTGGMADRLGLYLAHTGRPDYVAEDLARFEALSPDDISQAVVSFLRRDRRVLLSVVPLGRSDLSLTGSTPVRKESGS